MKPNKTGTKMDIQQIFSTRNKWQIWLDVEAALARAQAQLGMIPAEAADEIARKADLNHIDETILEQEGKRTRAPIVALVRTLAEVCGDKSAGYVHWGATTQNVMQTGYILLMRRAHKAFMGRMGGCFNAFAALAEKGAEMIMPGRTQRRHALPITFGFKVAGWIEEFLRHQERFKGVEPRVFTVLFGGAVGAMHAFGEQGPALNRKVAELLELGWVSYPSRAAIDHIAEYIMLLALFGATCSKIAQELYVLMSDEIGEVVEDLGMDVIGSSTMPQKVNSKIAVNVIAQSSRLRSQVMLALDATQSSHEGDAAYNKMIYAAIESACPLACELAGEMEDLLSNLRLMPDRMRENLDISGGMITSENAMMLLAPVIGRQKAHDIVHHAVAQAVETGASLSAVLLGNDTIRNNIDEGQLRKALDPVNYTGRSVSMARDAALRAREAGLLLRT